jgi:pimeloyl-ACP methyl ester carboxylesterase
MSGDMFEPVLESLSKDYRVLVPDLRGFGRSGHLAPPYTVAQHAYDLTNMDQLEEFRRVVTKSLAGAASYDR